MRARIAEQFDSLESAHDFVRLLSPNTIATSVPPARNSIMEVAFTETVPSTTSGAAKSAARAGN